MQTAVRVSHRHRFDALLVVYVVTTFLASALVFLVQPMAARMLLPRFGGSAAVWNTALVVFQTLLLAGYAFAHLVTRLRRRVRLAVQTVVILAPAALLPFSLPSGRLTGSPTLSVLVTLTTMVGVPYFVLTTLSPTIQRWFAETGHPRASNPYPLYAAGNLGSLLALLGYPVVIEPLSTVGAQTKGFAIAYAALAVLLIVAMRIVWRAPETAPIEPYDDVRDVRPLGARQVVYLGFVPSLLLLGVTRYLSTDVAAFPLLWVIPLVVYLGSFVVAFGARLSSGIAVRGLRMMLIPAILTSVVAVLALWFALAVPLAVLAFASVVAHRRLYDGRPPAAELTRFYMLMSTGGALGGIAGALVAPVVFNRVLEYPVGLVLAATVLPFGGRLPRRWPVAVAAFGGFVTLGVVLDNQALALLALGVAGIIVYGVRDARIFYVGGVAVLSVAMLAVGQDFHQLEAVRTFYGAYRVVVDGEHHVMLSGTTIHGQQLWNASGPSDEPLSYYARRGPAGKVVEALQSRLPALDVGLVGLGAGTLATYGRPTDHLTYYELDPAVVALAENPGYFTYLRDSSAEVRVVTGDGRLELEALAPRHDLLVLDAFSSDSIPVHLMTREAFQTYLASITDDGVLAFHISNLHIDLAPVMGSLATDAGLEARIARYQPGPDDPYGAATVWVVMSRSISALEAVTSDEMWSPLADRGPLWTDDYSDIVSVIVWG